MRIVLQRLREAGLKLNDAKCELYTTEIHFLGHVWNAAGIRNSDKRISALKEMQPPNDPNALRSFLGMISYLGQTSIPHFSTLVQPMWDMLKSSDFKWTDIALENFQILIKFVCQNTIRPFFNPEKKIRIQTDASGVGIGAVLLQDNVPIIFISRTLTDTEMRYSQLEKEFLAIVFALKRLSKYLIGLTFVLDTDNKAIVQLFDKPIDKLSNRLQRWRLAVQHFNVELKFIKGADNLIADSLSRNSIKALPTKTEKVEYTICKIL